MKGALLAALALAAIAALAAALALGGGSSEIRTPTAQVESGPFLRRVVAEGNLEPVEATPVNGPIDAEGARKIAWMVPDGTLVREGEVVVRFDPTEMEKKLEDGEASERTAESRIAGTRAQADGTIVNLGRDASMARLELETASQFQSKDPEIFSRHEIIRSEIDRDLATQRLDHAESTRSIHQRVTAADLELLSIERRKARITIDQARQGLSGLEVRAPHDGILVYKRDWRGGTKNVGDSVWPGEPIGEIPRLESMRAKVYVLEADAGGLAKDLPATIVLEAHPDRPIEAKIDKVATLAKRRVGWVPVQYFEVTLALERTVPEIMKPGQRLRAELRLDERSAALMVPRGAIFEKDGKKIAYRLVGRDFEPVEVSLGPAAVGRVVIESGLGEADRVALEDPTRVADEASGAGETGVGIGPGGTR